MNGRLEQELEKAASLPGHLERLLNVAAGPREGEIEGLSLLEG